MTQGFYDLRVVADFMQGKIEKVERESVKVMQPLFIQDAYFDDDNTCNSNEICSKTIILDLLYSGKKEFDSEDFDFSVYVNELEKKVGVDQVICTQASKASASVSCVLSVNFPALDPGSYTIDVSLTSKLEPYLKDERVLYLDVVISLSGTLMDATGGIIHGAKLTFENLETGEIYSRTTDALGKYSVDLLPGRYNVLLEFSNLRADLKDVKINKDTLGDIGGELIKYDSFGASGVIEGFKVTKVVVLEFGLPFEKAYLVIPYDDRYVYDENQLKVFECKNWNFGARRCVGNWSEVDSKVYPTRNRVEFNVSSLSAFVLGEKKQLSFYTLSLNKEEVNMGDTIVITGKVVDSEGKGVEGVNLEFSFPDFGINSSTITTTGGVFSGTITAPYKDGVFKLVVRANKGPYSPAVEEKPIKVTKKGDFSIILPDVVNVILDQPQEINLTLVNSGQLDLEKIKIRVSGISTDFFNLIPPEINLLKPNEQKKITMRFMFTSENCGEKCSQYYLVSLGVEATTSLGEKISKGGSFTVKLLPPQKPEEKEEGQLNLKLPSLTGLFVLPKSLNNQTNLMIVVAVILLVVAVISKMKIPRRREGKSLSYRSFNKSLIGRIKKEVKGK
ncbi:MAG TPA: carboxypeptidase regulatory-like domain-containing protein [Candidatus Aenigmarchaeota archaeon]|nr:carboxypeptidase regulatory-like domain-containing protein [Candidatus Aenigmarchaeota archaeon]